MCFKSEYQLRVADMQCYEQIDMIQGFQVATLPTLTSERRSRLIKLFRRAVAASYNETLYNRVSVIYFLFFTLKLRVRV